MPGKFLVWGRGMLAVARLDPASRGACCPVCGDAFAKDTVYCEGCAAPHHADCWRWLQQCSTYGCGRAAGVVRPGTRTPDFRVAEALPGVVEEELRLLAFTAGGAVMELAPGERAVEIPPGMIDQLPPRRSDPSSSSVAPVAFVLMLLSLKSGGSPLVASGVIVLYFLFFQLGRVVPGVSAYPRGATAWIVQNAAGEFSLRVERLGERTDAALPGRVRVRIVRRWGNGAMSVRLGLELECGDGADSRSRWAFADLRPPVRLDADVTQGDGVRIYEEWVEHGKKVARTLGVAFIEEY